MSQPGNEALLIQITQNTELMLNASSAGPGGQGETELGPVAA